MFDYRLFHLYHLCRFAIVKYLNGCIDMLLIIITIILQDILNEMQELRINRTCGLFIFVLFDASTQVLHRGLKSSLVHVKRVDAIKRVARGG